ncbi:hypothetical protein ABD90_22285 [Lysinibacillus fusiformis]|uniref:Uncharacterized protein n=1 Tax=Lysinibacillus sphaericus CBAM5 TaxID=1400869 RepID=W7S1C1_LYSSH|nr:hypothetical protein AR327_15180 [Lysinibacillus sphaericus]EWH33400.1 hypothetical protein P799_09090 [Lysinibacillus sphaericus CBAM5]MBG9727893.1 hypothetical protein [Lysinibacillus fusiformis]AMR91212.1 hypothetical protein A1T07_14030 [Lysinibacillus sphaericus]ANA45261.1 hypothetical protein A2J09_06695 [Lysinibacillus sphaericus]
MREIKQYTKDQKLQLASGEAWTPLEDDDNNSINLLFTKTNGFPAHPDSMFRSNLDMLTFKKRLIPIVT